MNCFNHRTEVAVGICTLCGRGVCAGCCMTSPDGLSCGESHANAILSNQTASTLYGKQLKSIARQYVERGLMFAAISIVCVFLAKRSGSLAGVVWGLAAVVGIGSVFDLARGAMHLRRSKNAA